MESHRLVLSLLIAVALIGTMLFSNPTITGYVPTEVESQHLALMIDESERFVLRSNASIEFSSFSISGEVIGQGYVTVNLVSGQNKWLVFANKRKRGASMEQITGFSALEVSEGKRLDRIETLPDGYQAWSGAFQTQCVETCVLNPVDFSGTQAHLEISVEPGTVLKISELQFVRKS